MKRRAFLALFSLLPLNLKPPQPAPHLKRIYAQWAHPRKCQWELRVCYHGTSSDGGSFWGSTELACGTGDFPASLEAAIDEAAARIQQANPNTTAVNH